MTFDEFKEYTRAALEMAGDATPEMRTAIVIAVINGSRVLMPSDLEQQREMQQQFAVNTGNQGFGRGPGAIPTR